MKKDCEIIFSVKVKTGAEGSDLAEALCPEGTRLIIPDIEIPQDSLKCALVIIR